MAAYLNCYVPRLARSAPGRAAFLPEGLFRSAIRRPLEQWVLRRNPGSSPASAALAMTGCFFSLNLMPAASLAVDVAGLLAMVLRFPIIGAPPVLSLFCLAA